MDNSKFDFDMDPEFSKKFYENIDKILSEGDTSTQDLESEEFTIKSEDRIDDEIYNINASLAEQICNELDKREEDNQSKQSKFPSWFKVPAGILAGLLLLISFLGFTKPGNQLLLNLGVNIGGKVWAVWTNDLSSGISAAEDTDHLEEEDLNTDGPEADISKIILMCICHDLGEAITGDIPSFKKNDKDRVIENNAVNELINSLPEPYKDELSELFLEMEEQKTLEARIYKALDKMEVIIQHNEADLSTWIPLEYELNLLHGEKEVQFSEYMKKLRQTINEDTINKIRLADEVK